MCLLTAGVLFARKPAIGFIPGSQRVHHQHSSQGKSSSPGLSTQMQPSSSSSSTASSHGPATSPWAHNTSLNSHPTSDKAGSLGHSAGPVFFLSPSMYTFYRFSNPRPAIRTEASITEKTKCWAPTADSRTFEVWYIYICSKLQLVILFVFWGCVIQRGATTTYRVTMPWTQGAVLTLERTGCSSDSECCIKARFFSFFPSLYLHLYLLHSWIKQQELLSAITKENMCSILVVYLITLQWLLQSFITTITHIWCHCK